MITGDHAPEQRAPALDEHLEHTLASEQRERLVEVDADAARARRDRFDLGARGAPRVDRARRGIGRRDHERRCELRIEERPGRRHAPAGVEHDAQRWVLGRLRDVSHGERRAVGDRGAGTDDDRLRVGAQLVRVGARGVGRDPARGTVGGRDPTVEARRDLGHDERAPGSPMVEVRRELARGFVGADADGHVDSRGTQTREARTRDPRIRVFERRDDARHPGRDQRVGARRGAPVMRAGLERDVRGRAAGAITGSRERAGFGVRASGRLGGALADDLAVAHEHAADPRIRRGTTTGGGAHLQRLRHRLVVAHGPSLRALIGARTRGARQRRPNPAGAPVTGRGRRERRRDPLPSGL